MRYIRYLFLAVLGVALIAVALANREIVSLKLLPEGLARIAGMNQSVELPLFAVIFGGAIVGLLIGFVWEWLREHKHRAEASRKQREVGKLEREVKKLKGEKHRGKDEVLALLD
ncbi:phosphoribosylanthranilate isomerase [Primorskyibacter flagellatus]|uniref:Phosphoribosylanthranilate isomerase n=1 Tax=Primorskyibacter flagellatus TaxID=1387277 RepID=A0A917EIP1_9RHOB|nr:LapA family protein [Primorskyibacter flagellatus]GGE41071.1 phosphoribosylanthranilate isomerase [Primorskyibacter flagellatus]